MNLTEIVLDILRKTGDPLTLAEVYSFALGYDEALNRRSVMDCLRSLVKAGRLETIQDCEVPEEVRTRGSHPTAMGYVLSDAESAENPSATTNALIEILNPNQDNPDALTPWQEGYEETREEAMEDDPMLAHIRAECEQMIMDCENQELPLQQIGMVASRVRAGMPFLENSFGEKAPLWWSNLEELVRLAEEGAGETI